jgi:hypothetical protein
MANVFKPKRSSTASSVPTTSDLADGELAVNSSDQKIYLREGSNIVEVGNTSGGISNVVEDTTPQLGGNLDVNGKNINFGDSASASDDRLNFGVGTDLSIYFDGTNSYIDVNPDAANHLYIRNNVGSDQNGDIRLQAKSGENSIICYDDSSVELYYDNSVKLTTTSTGFSVTGTGLGNWKVNDDNYLTAGNGDDFQIYHNGTSTFLDNDTGHLFIRTNVADDVGGNIYLRPRANEEGIIIHDDSSVELYYDNSAKLTTTSTGFTVTGTGLANAVGGGWKVNDDRYLTAGNGDDLQIYHDGTSSYLDNDTGHLFIRNNVATDVGGNIYLRPRASENGIVIYDDAGVELYYDNAVKLTTTSTGVSVTGTLSTDEFSFGDNKTITFGASSDLSIYHGVSNNVGNSYIDNDTGHLFIRNNVASDVGGNIYLRPHDNEEGIIIHDDAGVELYYDNSAKLTTTSTGFTVTGTGLGNWKANDNSYLTAGNGDDFQIYHNGTSTFLDNDTGHLFIRTNVADDVGGNIYLRPRANEEGIVIYDDAGVELYYDNASKLETTSTGFTVTGTGLGNFKANDNSYLTAGTGDDLQIYHNGTSSYLDNDTGHLYIRNNVAGDVGGNIYLRPHDNEEGIVIHDDAGVELYHDNSLKLTTSSTGITITGTGIGDGWKVNDSEYFTAGTGDDFQIYHNGSHTYLDNDTGNLYIRNNVASDVNGDIYIQAKSGENGIVIQDDGEVQLYYDNVEKLNTSSSGVTVTGTVTATGFSTTNGTSSQFLKADGSVDSSTYLTSFTETNDLSSAVTWANVPNANITQGSVTQHQAALSITESQISDLQSYLTSYTETDPVVAAINGIVKSNGTTISAATAGTDYLAPSGDGSSLTGLTGASAATYGDSGSTPVITVDANGRITGITTVAAPATITRTATRIVATNGQTAFTVATYDSTLIDVYLNGVKLDSTEYATTNSTTITLTTGASTGDIFESVSYTNFSGTSVSSVTVADESSDTTCFPLFATAATGDVEPKSGSNLTFDSASGILGATTFQGNLDLAGLLKEGVNITAGKLSANTNIDLADGMVHLFTTTETATSTPNIRVDSSTSLDSSMSTGESVTVVLISAAAAAGYSAQLTIDGSAVTESWLGGSAPSTGGSGGYDVYTYNIIKTGSATFVVLANVVNFA